MECCTGQHRCLYLHRHAALRSIAADRMANVRLCRMLLIIAALQESRAQSGVKVAGNRIVNRQGQVINIRVSIYCTKKYLISIRLIRILPCVHMYGSKALRPRCYSLPSLIVYVPSRVLTMLAQSMLACKVGGSLMASTTRRLCRVSKRGRAMQCVSL